MSQVGEPPKYKGMQYETYLESWGSNYMELLQGMHIRKGVVVNIAFGKFEKNLGGLFFSPKQLEEIDKYVHSMGGELKLSLGGATYPFSDTLKSGEVEKLAKDIAETIKKYNFDGVDLDIENHPNADSEIAFIKKLRENIGSEKVISLTVPGQDWSSETAKVIPEVKGEVNYFSFMEYDISIDRKMGLVKTIQEDVKKYQELWQLSPNQIEIGLMPGEDDMRHKLSAKEADEITKWAKGIGLLGIMTWDINRDSSFIYTKEIMKEIFD